MAASHFHVAVGRQQERGDVAQLTPHERKGGDRRLLGEMDVVQHQDARLVAYRGRERLDYGDQGTVVTGLVGRTVGVARRDWGVDSEVSKQAGPAPERRLPTVAAYPVSAA